MKGFLLSCEHCTLWSWLPGMPVSVCCGLEQTESEVRQNIQRPESAQRKALKVRSRNTSHNLSPKPSCTHSSHSHRGQGPEVSARMSGLRQLIHSTYKTAAEKVLPTLSQSAFKEKGVSQ